MIARALAVWLLFTLALAIGLPTAWMIDDWRVRVLEADARTGAW